jgi:SWI/SNF-related matrix-associated actin-dependent regulator of chromatin subfamily A3
VEADEQFLTHSTERPVLQYSPPDRLMSGACIIGKIEDRSAQILQTLHEDSSLDMQIVLAQRRVVKPPKRRFGQALNAMLFSVILYGPENIAEDVGQFCQDCDIYLQDPHDHECDRNVVYDNPHCLSSSDGQRRMTFELYRHSGDAVITEVHRTDTLEALIAPRWLGEISTPSALQTDLFP